MYIYMLLWCACIYIFYSRSSSKPILATFSVVVEKTFILVAFYDAGFGFRTRGRGAGRGSRFELVRNLGYVLRWLRHGFTVQL